MYGKEGVRPGVTQGHKWHVHKGIKEGRERIKYPKKSYKIQEWTLRKLHFCSSQSKYLVLSVSVHYSVAIFVMCRCRALCLSWAFALFFHQRASIGVNFIANTVGTTYWKSCLWALKLKIKQNVKFCYKLVKKRADWQFDQHSRGSGWEGVM